ncbi:hypothetical protein ACN74_14205 [Escherichia coli]|nr:hypothetical protein ACN74_14205 [Escherichia coli]
MFIVLSGFATTDLSVRFCDACQGGEAYGKTPLRGRGLIALVLAFRYAYRRRICLLERSVRSPQISDRA